MRSQLQEQIDQQNSSLEALRRELEQVRQQQRQQLEERQRLEQEERTSREKLSLQLNEALKRAETTEREAKQLQKQLQETEADSQRLKNLEEQHQQLFQLLSKSAQAKQSPSTTASEAPSEPTNQPAPKQPVHETLDLFSTPKAPQQRPRQSLFENHS